MTYRTNGHGSVALGPNLAMDRVWDLQYVEEMGDYFPWIQRQWDSMCEDTYWDNDGDDHRSMTSTQGSVCRASVMTTIRL